MPQIKLLVKVNSKTRIGFLLYLSDISANMFEYTLRQHRITQHALEGLHVVTILFYPTVNRVYNGLRITVPRLVE
jgi:hypothetical protein